MIQNLQDYCRLHVTAGLSLGLRVGCSTKGPLTTRQEGLYGSYTDCYRIGLGSQCTVATVIALKSGDPGTTRLLDFLIYLNHRLVNVIATAQ